MSEVNEGMPTYLEPELAGVTNSLSEATAGLHVDAVTNPQPVDSDEGRRRAKVFKVLTALTDILEASADDNKPSRD